MRSNGDDEKNVKTFQQPVELVTQDAVGFFHRARFYYEMNNFNAFFLFPKKAILISPKCSTLGHKTHFLNRNLESLSISPRVVVRMMLKYKKDP